jgi:hypothetical protein
MSLINNDQLECTRIKFPQPFDIIKRLIGAYSPIRQLRYPKGYDRDSLHIGSPTRNPLALLDLNPISWSKHPSSRSFSLTCQIDTADQYQRSGLASLIRNLWNERHEHCSFA